MRELASSALRAIALGALAFACGKESLAPPPPIVWHDLATGEALARKEHKPAVVFVYADWSVADMMLKRDTFPHPDVRQAMKDFVAIEIDATNDESAAAIKASERFAVVGVPTILVVGSFDRYPERRSDDTRPPDLFRANEMMTPAPLVAALHAAKHRFDTENAQQRDRSR